MILSGLKSWIETGAVLTTPGSLAYDDRSDCNHEGEEVTMSTTKTTVRINNIGSSRIPVTDQDRSSRSSSTPSGSKSASTCRCPAAHTDERMTPESPVTIALVAHVTLPVGFDGINHDPDTEADHADLVARGVDVDEILRWPGVPAMFAFRDPDGDGFEASELREITARPTTHHGRPDKEFTARLPTEPGEGRCAGSERPMRRSL